MSAPTPAHRASPSAAAGGLGGSAGSGAARVEFQAVILATSFGSALFPLTRENAVVKHEADTAAPGGVSIAAASMASPSAGGSGVGAAYTDPIGRAHLPIANRPLLHYQLDMVHKAGFPQVIVVTRDSMRRGVARIVDEWRVARGGGGGGGAAAAAGAANAAAAAAASSANSLEVPSTPTASQLSSSPSLSSLSSSPALLEVDLVSLDNYRGTADALRCIADKIHTDFFCLSGDLVSNVQFQNLADLHRSQDAGLIMCVQQLHGDHTDKDKDKGKEKEQEAGDVDAQYMGIDASTGRLLLFKSAADVEESLPISKRLLARHPNFTLHTKLRDCHLYVFSQWVLYFLQDKTSILSIQSELIPCLVSGQYRAKYNEWRHYSKNASQLAALRMSHASQKQNEAVLLGSAASPAPGSAAAALAGGVGGASSNGLAQTTLNREYSSLDLLSSAARNMQMSASGSMTNMSDVSGRGGLGLGGAGSAAAAAQESFRIFVYEASAQVCARANSLSSYRALNLLLAQDIQHAYMPWPALGSDNHALAAQKAGGARMITAAPTPPDFVPVIGEGVSFPAAGAAGAEPATIKRSCVGRHCVLGSRVKLQGCVLMDGAVIEEGCSLTDCIVGMGALVGKNCVLKDCKIGPGFRVEAATEAKNEILCDDD